MAEQDNGNDLFQGIPQIEGEEESKVLVEDSTLPLPNVTPLKVTTESDEVYNTEEDTDGGAAQPLQPSMIQENQHTATELIGEINEFITEKI